MPTRTTCRTWTCIALNATRWYNEGTGAVVTPRPLHDPRFCGTRAMPCKSTDPAGGDHSHEGAHVCHPYARISDPQQRKGGGLVRQVLDPHTALRVKGFCRLFHFALSPRVRVDDGVSAFHGLNATPEHELGRFIAEARAGVVRPGDCLLLENYDRLSRQDPWAAIGLVNDLRQLKVHVGRLDRMKLLRHDSTDPGDFFEASIELMRGHSESLAKSERNGSAWRRKRDAARAELRPMTGRLPLWVRNEGGKLALVPERAAAVRRIFLLAAAGYGYTRIVRRLAELGVPAFGRSGWSRPYVTQILNDRRAVGECQPRRRRGRAAEGPPIPNYFPPAVTQEEYWAAHAAIAARRERAGGRPTRIGRNVNRFAGLLREAGAGGTYFAGGSRDRRRYVAYDSTRGEGALRSFPVEVFDGAVLKMLSEIDPHDVLNGDHRDDSQVLAGQHAALGRRVEELVAEMRTGDIPALAPLLRQLSAEHRALGERLAEA